MTAPKPTLLDNTLVALADPTRRRVIDMLRQAPRRPGDFVDAFSISAPAISRHLRILRAAGLVEEEFAEHDARIRIYRLRPEPFAGLQDWLEQVAGFWSDQLASFKAHAEAPERAE